MRRSSQVLLSGLIVLLVSVSNQAQHRPTKPRKPQAQRSLDAREIARRAFSSTVLLIAEDANGEPVSQGSGFFVKPQVIATSYHVVKDASQIFAQLTSNPSPQFQASVLRFDEKTDLALLTISRASGKPIAMFLGKDLYVGDDIYAIGNPKGLDATFSKGSISAFREFDGISYIQVTAPLSPGSSGGPILNRNGQVIAVVQSQVSEGQNLNFAVAYPYLLNLVDGRSGLTVAPSYDDKLSKPVPKPSP